MKRWQKRTVVVLGSMVAVALAAALAVQILLPLTPDPPGVDVQNVPGPWENHSISLPDRVGSGPLRVHYLAAGPAGASVVVLLHGFPDTSYGWRSVIPRLSGDFRVLAPDLRGYAGTDHPASGYDLGTLAGDLYAFVEQTNVAEGRDPAAPVHIISHDWGALVTWRAITEAPRRFIDATVLDIPHPLAFADQYRASAKQREYRWFVAQLISPGAARLLAGLSLERRRQVFYLDELHDDSKLTEADGRYYHAVFNTPGEMKPALMYYEAFAAQGDDIQRDFAARGKVTIPTLVLWGGRDSKMMPEMAAMSCEHVSARCEHEVFPESGHYAQWEEPEGVVKHWRSFIAPR